MISVVTPCLNVRSDFLREKYFHKMMNSVHNQTYKDIEHIVIDGGSKDGTLDLLDYYKKKGWIDKIISEKDRLELLASCEYDDYVVLFDDDTPLELIKKIGPDVVVKGADYKEEDVVGYGIVPEIKRCPLVEGISTTKIIEKIKSL